MTTVLPIEDASQVGHARRVAQSLAVECAFDEADAGRVALAATELATNLLKHAQHGALHLRRIPAQSGPGIELIAIDRGPGFNPNQCLADGFSTGGTQGTGLGAGTAVRYPFRQQGLRGPGAAVPPPRFSPAPSIRGCRRRKWTRWAS